MAVLVEWLGGVDQWWPNRRFLLVMVSGILNGFFLGSSSVGFSCLSPFRMEFGREGVVYFRRKEW